MLAKCLGGCHVAVARRSLRRARVASRRRFVLPTASMATASRSRAPTPWSCPSSAGKRARELGPRNGV